MTVEQWPWRLHFESSAFQPNPLWTKSGVALDPSNGACCVYRTGQMPQHRADIGAGTSCGFRHLQGFEDLAFVTGGTRRRRHSLDHALVSFFSTVISLTVDLKHHGTTQHLLGHLTLKLGVSWLPAMGLGHLWLIQAKRNVLVEYRVAYYLEGSTGEPDFRVTPGIWVARSHGLQCIWEQRECAGGYSIGTEDSSCTAEAEDPR